MKIVFCGAGNVTRSCLTDMMAAIRYQLPTEQLEIVVHNHILNHATAVVMDLKAGISVYAQPARLTISSTDNLIALANADLVIVTAGTFPSEHELSDARKTGTDREIQSIVNYPIISEIAIKIRHYAPNAHVIMVTNQVDFCTQLTHDITGFPQGRILGFGGLLDTNRYKLILAKQLKENYNIDVGSVSATIVGHHNASMFPLSNMVINGRALSEIISDRHKREAFLQSVLEATRRYGAAVTELNKGNVGSHLGPGALLSQTILAFTGIGPSFTAPFTVILGGSHAESQIRGALSIPVTISRLSAGVTALPETDHQDLVRLRSLSQDFQEKYLATKSRCEGMSFSHAESSAPRPNFFR